mgnify:CR=1 FL=1|tara:strand:- start:61 stop:264 length:204 start_codon:yes stop_codon:yes gene_type:complete
MNGVYLDSIYKKLCENKDVKESVLQIKKYIDYSFIFIYLIVMLVLIVFIITIVLLLTIIYLLNKQKL